MLFPTLGPSSLPVAVAQPDERHANRKASVLEWYDRHVHNPTSGSNEEEEEAQNRENNGFFDRLKINMLILGSYVS